MTFGLRHLLVALVLHVALFALLLGGLQCSRKPERPPVIQAVLLDPDRKEVAQRKREQEQRRVQERQRAENERKRKDEEARRKLEKEQQQRAAEEQKRQVEAERKKQLEEEQRRQKELADRKKAEETARRQQEEQQRRERLEQEQRDLQERARLEEELRREALAREMQREAQARAASQADKERAAWIIAVQNHVSKRWHPPPMAPEDFSCMVRIQQLPDGTVTSARITQSCGNPQLNASVEEAVLRASPLPTVSNPSLYLREFLFEFVP